MSQYRPGDRVLAVKNVSGRLITGVFGTVVYVKTDCRIWNIGVEFDQDISGHDCSGFAIRPHGLWVSASDLILIEKAPPKKSGLSQFLEKHS